MLKNQIINLTIALLLSPIIAFGAVIDNIDIGFSSSAPWSSSTFSTGYYGGNYFYTSTGNVGLTGTWTFTINTTAQYNISAQWTANSNRAQNATYTLLNNGINIGSYSVDQRVNGGVFNLLTSYPLQAGSLNVVLSGSATGVVIADAIDVTNVGPAVNVPPNGVIDSPSSIAIAVGDFVNFMGTGTDSDGNFPLTYLWQFDIGSGVTDLAVEDPGMVQFNVPGTYNVTFVVTDGLGLPDPTPPSVTITVGTVIGGTVLDNVGIGFSTTGTWSSSTSSVGYYGVDYYYSLAGSGARTATWNTSITTAGQYDISANWTSHSNRTPDATYKIYNNGVLIGSVIKNQRVNGGVFNLLSSSPLQVGNLDVVLTNSVSGVMIADAVDVTYVGTIANIAPNGVIDLPSNISISPGDFVNFLATGTDADGNTPLSYAWSFGAGSGIPDSNVEDPGLLQFSTAGVYTVQLVVTDSKGLPDPSPATVTITVGSSTAGVVVDDTDAGFSTLGNWSTSSSTAGYYGTDYRYVLAGTGANLATWSFGVVSSGQYNISAMWTAHSNRAPNAKYTLYNNGVNIGVATVDQRINGGAFNLLMNYPLQVGTLEVVLSDNASGIIVADAIEMTYLGPPANIEPQSIINTPSSLSVLVGDYVDFTGTGTDLDGNTPLNYSWNFGVGSGIPDSSLRNPGLLQFNSVGTFDVTFTVTDSLGLADSTPAKVTIIVNSASSGSVIDNSDAAFSSTAGWANSVSLSSFYGTDYTYAFAGTGSNTAAWSFSISVSGLYDVSAWWTSHVNRATNAPYSIYNNGILLDTVRVNQEIDGGQFNLLSNYPLQAGILTVVTSDDANDIVVADAVQAQLTSTLPTARIVTPSNLDLLVSGDINVNVATTNYPAGYSLKLVIDGDIAGGQVYPVGPFQVSLTGLVKGEHGLTLQVLDEFNTVQGTSTVQFGVGDYYIAIGDSITVGTGDNVTSDNVSLDGRNSGGGFIPVLNDYLTASKGYPHYIVPAGIGGQLSLQGALRINGLLSLHPTAQRVLILFGTNDANSGVRSGLGLVAGNAGYDGSYKHNMQRMISSVLASGKQPMLAKIPATNYAEPKKSSVNTIIQQYNSVINELVALNGIAVTPPDLYSHFDTNPAEISADLLHPNGTGYRSIANLWRNSIIAAP